MSTVVIAYSDNPRPKHVAATVCRQDGTRVGHVVCQGKTFYGARKQGTDEDMRRIGYGFRSAKTAAEWVAKSA